MKSSIEKLSEAERKALVHWYNTESFKAFKKLCKLEIEGFGRDALGSTSHEQTRWFSGAAGMAVKLPKAVRDLYEKSEENKKKKS